MTERKWSIFTDHQAENVFKAYETSSPDAALRESHKKALEWRAERDFAKQQLYHERANNDRLRKEIKRLTAELKEAKGGNT